MQIAVTKPQMMVSGRDDTWTPRSRWASTMPGTMKMCLVLWSSRAMTVCNREGAFCSP